MEAETDIPEFCGFSCPHADFPPADSAGICRTMAAVYCKKLGRLVDKNTPCRYRGGRKTEPGTGKSKSGTGKSGNGSDHRHQAPRGRGTEVT